MTIRFVKYWNGYSPDAIVHNLGSTEEARLVSLGYATTDLDGPGTPEGELVRTVTGPNGEVSLQAGGVTVLRGQLSDGVWTTIPSVFRLRLTGTGTVTLDSKDAAGNITTGVASYTVSGATDQIEFPYAGDHAVAIRATLTGTATVEVI